MSDSDSESDNNRLSGRKARALALKAAREEKAQARLQNVAKNLKIATEETPTEIETVAPPPTIAICPTCGFPDDYCDFGSNWEVCKDVALKDREKYRSYLIANKLPIDGEVLNAVASGDQKKKKVAAAPATNRVVTIQRVTRAKRKVATIVTGLDSFGVKLDQAAKLFKKQFACGASAVKAPGPGIPDHVEIQGDFQDQVEAFITEKFPQVTSVAHLKPK